MEEAKLEAIEEIEKDLAGQRLSRVGVAKLHHPVSRSMIEEVPVTVDQQKTNLNPETASFAMPKKTPQAPQNEEGSRLQMTENLYYSIAKQQTDLTWVLMEQQVKATLPQRSMPIFNGNPIEYNNFMWAWNNRR